MCCMMQASYCRRDGAAYCRLGRASAMPPAGASNEERKQHEDTPHPDPLPVDWPADGGAIASLCAGLATSGGPVFSCMV